MDMKDVSTASIKYFLQNEDTLFFKNWPILLATKEIPVDFNLVNKIQPRHENVNLYTGSS